MVVRYSAFTVLALQLTISWKQIFNIAYPAPINRACQSARSSFPHSESTRHHRISSVFFSGPSSAFVVVHLVVL
jgi:hypothetical protein